MNVYQQNYSNEFIEELPIDFYRIKNMDLSQIPEVFHELFTTDWNWGKHSKMKWYTRNIMNDLSVEFRNWQIFEQNKKTDFKEEIFLGGFD